MRMTKPTAEHATLASVGCTLAEGGNPEHLEDFAEYLKPFAAPPSKEDHPCLKCGEPLTGFFGNFRWGIIHGEGYCANCGWPARLYHFVKDRHGNDLLTLRNLLLQYHPDCVEMRGGKEVGDA